MHKDLKILLSLTVFFSIFWVFLFVLTPSSINNLQGNRFPASKAFTSCQSLAQELLASMNRPAWKQFLEGKSRFNFSLYRERLEDYKELWSGKNLDEITALSRETRPSRPEEIMAYIDALNTLYKQQEVTKLDQMSWLSRRKLEKLAKNMLSEKKVLWRDLEEVVSEIYELNLGPRVKSAHFFNSELLKQQTMHRLFQEELAQRGLKGIFDKYKIYSDKPNSFKTFLDSHLGEVLKTSLFNLPVLLGAPPLYLPKLSPMKIPPQLADDILMNGFGIEQMQKLEASVKVANVGISGQSRYEIIRRYYSLGAIVYLSAASIYETYELEQVLEEEREMLQRMSDEIDDNLNAADELDQRGYQIFSDSQTKRHPRCSQLESCFEQIGLSSPYIENFEKPDYQECLKLLDPNDRCQVY